MAQEVGRYLAEQTDDTVTFLLGAGASLSSGAPATPTVINALTEQFPNEFPDSEISEGMDAISDAQVGTAIRPLFDDIEPHVGYLSLAALAKWTRVLVVNLNWDASMEIAALKRIGISCESIVLDEKNNLAAGLRQIKKCLEDPNIRIVNLHLHGRLDSGAIRLAPKRTATFETETIKMLWNSFFTHPTVVVGASLKGERDVTGMLTAAAQRVEPNAEPKNSPFWIFSRQSDQTDSPDDPVAAELLSRNECELNFQGDPFVDFDRIMVEILAERRGRPIRDVLAKTHVGERSGGQLVFPAPKMLRKYLLRNGRILALIGERKIGKTMTARLLAHWESLHNDDGIEICSHWKSANCGKAVAALREGTLDLKSEDVMILDDPFSLESEKTNGKLVADLIAIREASDAPRIVVTASPRTWHRVMKTHPELGEHADMVAVKSTEWYEGHDLAGLAENAPGDHPALVTRRVLEGVASTPERVRAVNTGEHPPHEEDVIADKLALMRELSEEVKQFLALVRFYELSRTVVPQVEMAKSFKNEQTDLPPWAKPMLRASELIDEEHLLFAHHTDRIAFDRLYQEDQKSLRSTVVDLAYGRSLVNEVCQMWLLISDVRKGNLDGIEELVRSSSGSGGRKLLEWGPLLLEEAAHSKQARGELERILKLLLEIDGKRDFWSLRELVYEVVRLWPELAASKVAADFIKDVLADSERMGCYCVLEALLYFQGAIHSGIWDRDYSLQALWSRLTTALWDRIEDVDNHSDELALVFDALAWSRPPLTSKELLSWVRPILDALAREESLKGAVALACLYHPDGLKLFKDLKLDSPLADIRNLTEEQMARAAEMVRWHYVHQSRGRALLTRRRLEPVNPELLQREQRDRVVPKAHADAITKFVERMATFKEHRGWAVHLAFNLRCTAGEFDDGYLGRLVSKASDQDLGIVTAALTYRIPGGASDQVQRYFRRKPNRELLLAVMLKGCSVDTLLPAPAVHVAPPRFMAGRIPQLVHLELQTEWTGRLQNIPNLHTQEFPHEVFRILEEAEREGLIDADVMWELLHFVQRGDLRPLEARRARRTPGPELQQWLQGREDELAEIVVSVCLDMAPDTLI